MTLQQLTYFCAVCRYHSIVRAAKALYISQPTISTAIHELEKEFHISLFLHTPNRIHLTEEGAAFYERANDLLQRARNMQEEFSQAALSAPPTAPPSSYRRKNWTSFWGISIYIIWSSTTTIR